MCLAFHDMPDIKESPLLFNGDSKEELLKFDDESIDCLVSDPPYAMDFMGKTWDKVFPDIEIWKQCLRVLKPGANGFIMSHPRTMHRLMVQLEDIGFEICNVLYWMYGSGFPKSYDISKGIDKKFGRERDKLGLNPNRRPGHSNGKSWSQKSPDSMNYNITKPSSSNAIKWQGFKANFNSLKPAWEPIIHVRKPLSKKNHVEQILRNGCGAINVDKCRVEYQNEDDKKNAVPGGKVSYTNESWGQQQGLKKDLQAKREPPQGRFPANLLLSHTPHCKEDECTLDCPVARLDKQSGSLGVSGRKNASKVKNDMKGTKFGDNSRGEIPYFDTGGASRFFNQLNYTDEDFLYCAKSSKSERGEDNTHNTVKPIKLMQWLCNLGCQPGWTVLDPFMGSGTTGVAALKSDFQFIGIELNSEYFNISLKRIENILNREFTDAKK